MRAFEREVATRAAAVAFGVSLVVATGAARAEGRTSELAVDREPDLATCPEREGLRELIAAKLGYDPIVAEADIELGVRFERDGRALVAVVERRRKGDDGKGSRRIRSETGDCNELAASVALAIAMLLDPDAAGRARAAPPPSPPPEPVTRVAAPPPPPVPAAPPPSPPREPSPDPDVPLRLALGAGPVAGAGHVPGLSVGPRVGIALRLGSFALGADATALIDGVEQGDAGTTRASAAFGSFLPCLRWSAASRWSGDACVEVDVGALFASAESVDRSFPTTEALVAVGPAGSIELALNESFAVRFGLSVVAAVSRVHLVIDDEGREVETWVTPPVAVLAALQPVVILP